MSQEIRGENKNSEPAAPLRISGESNRGQCTSDADDHHQQNRQPTNPLKSSIRFRIQSPKRIESTAGEQEQPDGQSAHASPKGEKDRKQLQSNWHRTFHQRSFFSLERLRFSALAANCSTSTSPSALSFFLWLV